MSLSSKRGISLLAGALWALISGAPTVLADDTELFVYDSSVLAVAPNILFVFDTSGSMDTEVESQEAYDPDFTYEGACLADRLYWRSWSWFDDGDPPTCDTNRWFERSAFVCKAGLDAFGTSAGRLTDQFAQYDPSSQDWEELSQSQKTRIVECQDDRGKHGDGTAGYVYARNDSSNKWATSPFQEIRWSRYNTHTVYDANYLNWYYGPTGPSTRIKVMKDVATSLVSSINGVNLGLMRFNDNADNGRDGGRLVHAVGDITANRETLIDAINGLPADGFTPLSETMYEAARYFLGWQPYYGDEPGPGTVDGRYQTPVQFACQKNYIVYLTDGEPTNDTDATDLVPSLPGFSEAVGAASCDGSGDGACLDDLAHYLHEADLNGNEAGEPNVTTYTIGFTVDLPILAETAELGGGRYYTADDTASLSQALTNIVTSILETQTTFTSPTVSVNSFNRTRHLNDLFVTVFQPSSEVHWPGNLKKYRLDPDTATIVDSNGLAAIDPETGFFDEDAQSYWSAVEDGPKVGLGGAAHELPPIGERKLYTYLAGSALTAAENAISTENDLIDATLLNLGDPGDPTVDEVIEFMLGRDVADSDQDNDTTDLRNQMGDPLHAQPVSIIYGGTLADPDINDALVFFATNDGYLHAIDPATGEEEWAFLAPEFLVDQRELLINPTSPAKHYGIDGNLSLQVLANEDGVIDPSSGEKVYLFFGMRRGGSVYYGLDVTRRDSPSLLWRLDETDLLGDPDLSSIGFTWSNPVPTRVEVGSTTQNSDHLVIVFGGGYDEAQDNPQQVSTDSVGNAIFIVDSVSGDVLWHGGAAGRDKDFADMDYSIPADVRVIDLDGDAYADRMYAADMGGQVWRFDITNGNAASALVDGGVIARLGSAGLPLPAPETETRRFYYAPDAALVNQGAYSFIHLGIGSGYRAHPNSVANEDYFYALRDKDPFRKLTQDDYDNYDVIEHGDLTDVTLDMDTIVPDSGPGWKLALGAGEKVLAEARTFDNQIFFTTFTPGAPPDGDNCVPRLGTNRLYLVSLFDGDPVQNLDTPVDDEAALNEDDRSLEFYGSIASEVVFLFPSPEDPENCVGEECSPQPVACVDLFCFPTEFGNAPVRTFWSQELIE